ncbi:hypothetical protein GA0115251_10803 [Streptomyces sp. TverLS-915]|uniref:DUF5685 family protein n=1 Tax=Streptomyces sp. TverLS-915 TaxID=1839763 RepID=UPI00081EC036|nr:DUF5685 family protein [Streptomyces sp. TverLS-915]SCD44537.1 hypothetical protein GA0115251_10803 [Streptomyces sp. TverLS-915]
MGGHFTMFGMVRPCAHSLGEKLKSRWMSHMCGLCLALRGDHGQFARIAANYDGIVISVLTEAQTPRERQGRRLAGPCALRGMRTARVSNGEGARLAGAVSLALAAVKVRDHVADGDGMLARRPVAVAAGRVASGWAEAAHRSAAGLGFDTGVLLAAAARQPGIEALAGPGTPLLTVTEPTETATAAAFAHTALLADRPHNAAPLAEAGRLFGRLAHLLDAVEDQAEDAARGAWNPLTATATPRAEARRLADDALRGIRLALADTDFTDPALAHRLLVHELPRSVDRAFGAGPACAHQRPGTPVPGNPYTQDPPGGDAPEPPRTPSGRGFWAGCGMFLALGCTCRLCCAEEYEGPWSGKVRHGCCHYADCCDLCDCDCCGCDGCGCDGCGCDGCCCDC